MEAPEISKTEVPIMKCCKDCTAPKRHVACWGYCPDYLAERAEYDRLKAEMDKKKAVKDGIYHQKSCGVMRAIKRHGKT